MDYKEFEKIRYYLSFFPSDTNQKVVFCVNKNDSRGISEKERQACQNKYGDMSYTDFKKQYDYYLPEANQRKYKRELLINEFKSLKTGDFADIPLKNKLNYLDAFSTDMRDQNEWHKDYEGAYDNLVACLWSIRPSDEFLAEERKKINHFMNSLDAINMNIVWNTLDLLDPKLQQRGIQIFLDIYSQAYKIDRIPVKYYIPKDSSEERDGFTTPGKWEINIRKDKKWAVPLDIIGISFHESTHLRQDKIYEENHEQYRIFNPDYGRIRNVTRIVYGAQKAEQIYELDPRESHAYYVERIFREMANDRIYKGRLTPVKLSSHLARTLWFDYQH